MTDENTEAIFAILLEHAEDGVEKIDADTVLFDIGIDSVGLVEIIFDIEDRFDVTVPDSAEMGGVGSEFRTAGDVVTAVKRLIEEQS
jgi:acyl carrier protein